ncbi:MAG TPA: hypothetical protein VFR63_00725 [Gaiellaceae bacterium]|nr:hypothetical protein [Gaiellaceae bacterium]
MKVERDRRASAGAAGGLRPATAGGRPPSRRALADWAVGAGVVVACAVVQLAFRQGPQPFDPAKYFRTAVDFPDVPADLWTLRIGLVAPVRLAVLVFGPSEAALYAVPFAVGLVLAAAVYGTMLLLFGDRLLGALAALVTVLGNDFLLRSSAILPDTTAAATFTTGIFFLVLGAGRRGRWPPAASAACAGLLFGWTYLIREFSPILLPAVAVTFVLLRYPLRRVAVVAGAALAAASLELVYGAVRHGDAFIHSRMLLTREDRPAGEGAGLALVREQLDGLLDTLAVFPRLVLAWDSGWAVLLLVAIFATALATRFRERRLWLLGAWFLSFWLTMALLGLASLPSGRWLLNVTSVRYWLPLFPALAMGAFAGIAFLFRGRVKVLGVSGAHAAAVALAGLVLGPGLVDFGRCADRQPWPNDPAERWHDLRSWLAGSEAERFDLLWTDRDTFRLLPAYTGSWTGATAELPASGEPEGGLLLVHKDRLTPADQPRLDALRRGRTPVFASGDGEMILLAETAAVDGDFSPPPTWWRLDPAVFAAEPGTCGLRPYRPW